MDGSNRVTLRNRKFIRKIHPACSQPVIPKNVTSQIPSAGQSYENTRMNEKANEMEPMMVSNHTPSAEQITVSYEPPSEGQRTPQRRGTRNRQPRQIFEARHDGKSHSYKNV